MMTRMSLRRASESFWVLPAALGLGAVVLAEVMLVLDRRVVGDGVWILADLSATGSRALLTTVGGSMLTVAATSFSITISVLATTSSTYGPRLVRNFMADRGNQLVLAVLTSSFVYCLVVLRAVRSDADGVEVFVPTAAVHVAVLIALVDVAVLVYFIHHIATSVQVTSLQQRVARELDDVVELLYPATTDREEGAEGASVGSTGRVDWSVVEAAGSGFVQQVTVEALVQCAVGADVVIDARATPGAHVVAGDALVRTSRPLDDASRARVAAAFELGPARTPHQDVHFAVQQLTEMAVRALSPGTNDPYTAIGALQALTPGLVTLCERPAPPVEHQDADGRVRVLLRLPDDHEVVRPVLAAVRAWGCKETTVVVAALDLAGRVLRAGSPPGSGDRLSVVVAEEVDALVERYRASGPHPVDAARVEAALAALPSFSRAPAAAG